MTAPESGLALLLSKLTMMRWRHRHKWLLEEAYRAIYLQARHSLRPWTESSCCFKHGEALLRAVCEKQQSGAMCWNLLLLLENKKAYVGTGAAISRRFVTHYSSFVN